MDKLYRQLKLEAERLRAQIPEPSFYKVFRREIKRSSEALTKSNNILRHCINYLNLTQEGLGHGFEHCRAVAIEAGALVMIEAKNYSIEPETLNRMIILTHLAGLLHDIKRGHKEHAIKASEEVSHYLDCLDLTKKEIEYIRIAIRNHEAFQEPVEPLDNRGRLISDCLYDADKFRWGPDNFTTTVWQMLDFEKISPREFFNNYQKGIEYIERIKKTFRTSTGRTYGPEIIDTGLRIGREIYKKLKDVILSS